MRSSPPGCLRWALSLSRAANSPTPLSAALRSFRSHGGIAPVVADWSLSSEASAPGSIVPCRERFARRGADMPAMLQLSHRHRFRRGRPRLLAGRWPRLDGSDLLPLRLLLRLQLGDVVFHAAQVRNVYELCQTRSFPANSSPLRVPFLGGAFWRGGPAGKRFRVLVLP
jgi:hypothetical protein